MSARGSETSEGERVGEKGFAKSAVDSDLSGARTGLHPKILCFRPIRSRITAPAPGSPPPLQVTQQAPELDVGFEEALPILVPGQAVAIQEEEQVEGPVGVED